MFQVVPPCGGHPVPSFGWEMGPPFQVVPPCGGHLAGQYATGGQVSSRAPVWGASDGQSAKAAAMAGFKSCPRVGGILATAPVCHNGVSFKSCPRVGGIWPRMSCPCQELVSSRAPVWGASLQAGPQNQVILVSSRAPVWGASCSAIVNTPLLLLFQVVPPCGGHQHTEEKKVHRHSFKSCPRVGGIRFEDTKGSRNQEVSSRAPVWGASTTRKYLNPYKLFQVVPPCGGHP